MHTAFLTAHDPDQHASLAIGAVAVVDGAAPADEEIKRLVAKRLQSIPRCTQLLRPQQQEWVDDPDFDLTRHLHRAAVSRPGDDAELARAVARVLERRLDPSRPPWECWVFEGLRGNRWAMVLKVHHRLADGGSAAHLLTRLCDDGPDGGAFAVHPGATPPSSGPEHGRAVPWGALGRVAGVAGTVVGALWPRWPGPSIDHVTLRRYGTVRVPIADVDLVCDKFGVTADDVALAAITEGFRTVLLRRGERPRADSLRTLVPLPGRSVMLTYLPVECDDPVQRLRTVHRQSHATPTDSPPSGIAASAINLLPTPLRNNAAQLLSRLSRSGVVTLTTNAPGPRQQVRLLGRTMERLLPIPPTAAHLNTGVAVQSYGGELVFGLTAEYGAAFDVQQLATGIELGIARLVALSQDSVLLFGKEHRRKRAPQNTPRAYPWTPETARH